MSLFFNSKDIYFFIMEPWFEPKDKEIYFKYIKNAKNYFEFGSGGSTYQSLLLDNIKKVYSVENNNEYFGELKSKIKKDNLSTDKLTFLFINMNRVKPNSSWPVNNLSVGQGFKESWSDYINSFQKINCHEIDLILNDGRFRASCLLSNFEYINNDTFILFDDFYGKSPDRSKYYHVVLDYYDIVEKGDVMVVLRKKKNIKPPSKNLIEFSYLIWI